jgi:hypothetical protein
MQQFVIAYLTVGNGKGKGKAIQLQALTGPEEVEAPSRHMKVARLSTLRTGRLYPQ